MAEWWSYGAHCNTQTPEQKQRLPESPISKDPSDPSDSTLLPKNLFLCTSAPLRETLFIFSSFNIRNSLFYNSTFRRYSHMVYQPHLPIKHRRSQKRRSP